MSTEDRGSTVTGDISEKDDGNAVTSYFENTLDNLYDPIMTCKIQNMMSIPQKRLQWQ